MICNKQSSKSKKAKRITPHRTHNRIEYRNIVKLIAYTEIVYEYLISSQMQFKRKMIYFKHIQTRHLHSTIMTFIRFNYSQI